MIHIFRKGNIISETDLREGPRLLRGQGVSQFADCWWCLSKKSSCSFVVFKIYQSFLNQLIAGVFPQNSERNKISSMPKLIITNNDKCNEGQTQYTMSL